MDSIDEACLKDEIADARKTLNHNIAELIKAEDGVEQLKSSIASTKGAISAFEYLLQGILKEKEPEKDAMALKDIEEMTGGKVEAVLTPKPDDSNPVGEEA